VAAWRIEATRLPEGEPVEAGITGSGRWTSQPPDGAERLPGRFVLPGLVDAHCHLSVAAGPDGWPMALSAEAARANLDSARASGVTAVRDTGSPASVTLELLASAPDLIACGRFLAPQDRYFPALHEPVPPEELVEAALAEVSAGARWVKLVADFPLMRPGEPPQEPAPSYELAQIRRLVEAVHAAGARVAAHTTTRYVTDLIGVGIDSVEHGTAIEEADLAALAERGGAWTPTLCATLGTDPGAEDTPQRAEARERLRYLLPMAAERGVVIMTGTDVVGTIAREVALLAELGLAPATALAAATTRARRFLGCSDLVDGEYADLVSYDDDPRADPAVLARPAAVVARGVRVR
jgi:imidazolonepropionase-like amidohydrolase